MASILHRSCFRKPICKLPYSVQALLSGNGFSKRNFHFYTVSRRPLVGTHDATLACVISPSARSCFSRCLSTETSHWRKVVSEAERVIGVEAPQVSLDGLFDGETGNGVMNSYMSKLLGSSHPLASYAKDWLCGEEASHNTRALVTLLVSKAAAPLLQTSSDNASHSQTDILPSQIELAEILEMIHTAYYVHRRIVKTNVSMTTELQEDLIFGNKMAVLSGDFLLSNACLRLAQLYNTQVVDVISSAISDMMEGFMRGADDVSLHQLNMSLWLDVVFKCKGSLLAKGCRSALNLAGHSEEIQTQVYSFAVNLSYAQQLKQEYELCCKNYPKAGIPVASLPVMFSKNNDAISQVLSGLTLDDHIDVATHGSVFEDSVKQNHIAENIEQFVGFYSQEAIRHLEHFPDSDTKSCLLNLARESEMTT